MLITQTPLRVSFVGGGTDFEDFYLKHDGEVVSAAIDKYIYVIVKERFDDDIYINYSKKEIVSSVDEIEHGLVREALRRTGIRGGIEITFLADIPSHGSGLGSSSTVTVGLLNALYAYVGTLVTAERLAAEACEIEIDTLKNPIGKQDQYIAAYGDIRHLEFCRDGSVHTETVRLSKQSRRYLSKRLMLFYTGIQRSASTILQEQKRNIVEREDELLSLKALVPKFLALLQSLETSEPSSDFIEEMGNLLHAGWMLKRELAHCISNPEIDGMYATARRSGAVGGKLLGAGGGGFLLLCVPLEKQEHVRRALKPLTEFPFDFTRDGSKTIFNIRQS